MSKFVALYKNEMIKISRKIVTIIVLIVMVLGVFACAGLIKLVDFLNKNIDFSELTSEMGDWRTEEMKSLYEDTRIKQKGLTDDYNALKNSEDADEIEIQNMKQELNYLNAQLEVYKYASENSVYIYSGDFIAQTLNSIIDDNVSLAVYEDIPEEESDEEILKAKKDIKERIEKRWEIVKNKEYSIYLDFQDQLIDEDIYTTQEEKNMLKESNALRRKIDPKGELMIKYSETGFNPIENQIFNIEKIKKSLLHNLDYTGTDMWGGGSVNALTPKGRKDLGDKLAVAVYKLEKKDFSELNLGLFSIREFAVEGMLSFGIFMIMILMLVLAGSAVSSEISTGSIKSLIIAPVKRYKIFFAKVFSLLTVGLISVVILYITSMLAHGIFFGFSDNPAYYYAIKGVVGEMDFYLHRLGIIGVYFIDIIVFTVFALMLSTITRNTAVSVGVAIAVYYGGNITTSIAGLFGGEWVKFLPFSNLSLANRIFDSGSEMETFTSVFGYSPNLPSVTFSIVYLIVLVFCIVYIALDSFNRRDIK